MTARRWFGLGALIVGIGVALGAFGAHELAHRITPARLGTFETAVRYQVYHGLAMMGVAAAERWIPAWAWAVRLFGIGVLVFAGSLYALVLTNAGIFGAVTPLGGLALLAGWGVVIWSALQRDSGS